MREHPAVGASVFVALPSYATMVPHALEGLLLATEHARYKYLPRSGSLIALMFNALWVTCLNSRDKEPWTHFAMHHADIEAPPGWIDTLLSEMDRTGADVLSVVMAIKDSRGLTSTGVMRPNGSIRRLTMTEVHDLCPTFDVKDVKALLTDETEDLKLMVNTGLWIARLDRTWVDDFPGFHVIDTVKKHGDDGKTTHKAHCLPEDWNASKWWAENGVKVMATRQVSSIHHGGAKFPNDHVWGDWSVDKGDG
jgi:hypothetical protein